MDSRVPMDGAHIVKTLSSTIDPFPTGLRRETDPLAGRSLSTRFGFHAALNAHMIEHFVPENRMRRTAVSDEIPDVVSALDRTREKLTDAGIRLMYLDRITETRLSELASVFPLSRTRSLLSDDRGNNALLIRPEQAIGTCYFHAAMMAVARTRGSQLCRMITQLDDCSYVVRAFENKRKVSGEFVFGKMNEIKASTLSITINDRFLTLDGELVFSRCANGTAVVPILEKAFMASRGGHQNVVGGAAHAGLRFFTDAPITGRYSWVPDRALPLLATLDQLGYPLVFSTAWDPADTLQADFKSNLRQHGMRTDHCYAFMGLTCVSDEAYVELYDSNKPFTKISVPLNDLQNVVAYGAWAEMRSDF